MVNNDWFGGNKAKVQISTNKWMQSSSGMRNSWQLPLNHQLCMNMEMVTRIIIMHFAFSIIVIISATGQMVKVNPPVLLWQCLCCGSSPGSTEWHMWVAEGWRIDNTHLCFALPLSYLPPSSCSFLCPMFACLSRRAWMAPTGFALCRAGDGSFQLDGKCFGKRLLLKRKIQKLFLST